MNAALQTRFEALKASGLLPSPRGVALAVMTLTRQDDASLNQIAHTIETDPALVSRLIKLTNSCQFAGARPVLAIKDAISVLGLNAVRGVALGLSLMAQRDSPRCADFDYPRFWSHNLACAVAMRVFSGHTRLMQGDEAFSLGLLARVGELGLAGLFPNDFARLQQQAHASAATLLRLEREAFGFDHADLSTALLQDWGLPAGLIQAVALHDLGSAAPQPDNQRFARIAQMLTLCTTVAELCLASVANRRDLLTRLITQGQGFDLQSDDLQTLCDEVAQDWNHWCGMLDIAAQKVPPLTELMAEVTHPPVTDQDVGDLQRLMAEIAQLTQRVEESRQRNLENEQRMELALQGSKLGLWDWQISSGRVTFDARWCAMLGYRVGELPTRMDTWQTLIHPQDMPQVMQILNAHLQDGAAVYETEHRLRHKNGQWVWVQDRGQVVARDSTGAALRMVGTHSDISQRKQVEAELLRSNQELEQFSYSISHDMRQPLRMISSYLQLLQKSLGQQLTTEQTDYLHFAVDGAQRMDTMMLGLLDYSRVGRKGEPMQLVDSRSLVSEALHFLHTSMGETQAQVQVQGEWPQVLVSPDEMLRLLQNLIANALKFHAPACHPTVTITSAFDLSHWTLCVADNGIGLAPGQIGRLFQMFARLQPRTAFEGTGIGLALCRKIAERHGGRIWAESIGEGQGSRFWVVLPLLAAPTPVAAQ